MGYTIKQKIEICLKSEAEPQMTQMDLANWAMKQYGSSKPPSQTTISRILSSKNEIIGLKEADFLLVRRRKQTNPLLRKILTEWITQAHWEQIPITTPIIQLTAYAIWTRLPTALKDGNGMFNHKWCNNFVKKLNINLTGTDDAIRDNMGYKLNKEWKLDEKLDLKTYIRWLISEKNYSPSDLFTIDEFSLFYSLPLDQIFDISSIDKGLKQSSSSTENMLTIMLGCNIDGSEKLNPLVVSKHESFDVSASSHSGLKSHSVMLLTPQALVNKVREVHLITYKANNNKWITSSMFQDYLLTLDHKIENSTPERNIVILLDNSSSHRMINLEFKHIKLVYLENTSKHKNPFNGSNSAKFDYLPMSFGIVEQFKILYRLQQYLEMINLQRNSVDSDTLASPKSGSSIALSSMKASDETEVLSERDYQIPFIKVIEWIRRSWDSITPEMIFLAWKQTYLINFKQPWPASDPEIARQSDQTLKPLVDSLKTYDSQKSYTKLKEIMKYLNVVIPWDIDDLLGLVNERSKVSLSYASIEEIIGSCILGQADEEELRDEKPEISLDKSVDPWLPSEPLPLLFPDQKFSQFNVTRMPEPVNPARANLQNIPPPLAPISPAPYTQLISRNNGTIPGMRQYEQLPSLSSKFRDSPYNDFAAASPGSMNINALLMATNVSKNEENLVSGFLSLAPMKQEILPPVLSRVDMNNPLMTERKHRLNPEFGGFPERKRLNYLSQNLSSFYPYNGPIGPLLMNDQNGDGGLDRGTGMAVPANFLGSTKQNFSRTQETSSERSQNADGSSSDAELIGVLNRIINASNSEGLKLSSFALEELKTNLSKIQHKYSPALSPSRL